MEVKKESLICMLNHLESLRLQALAEERANFGKPCATCELWDNCKGDWFSKIEVPLDITGKIIDLGHQVPQEKLGNDETDLSADSH
ncbi:hypothetical protein NIA71_01165 [Ihubacter massiliensis]|uniref:hypothetical protein n=1 Tax=Ihubacter massiliensis TaxID=1852367 RepID=UPI0020970006|nr:hypothetical protein [Ihubacter massiliensis]MCI7301482.1 hypothetical protein [Clostridia bacterium]MCO7120564.1 hypothetical protein [Ihubacter massiliensis]MDY3010629.1 hypothetical protein [Clostridiales Family XIII bacterium]